jgi:hypothetical protein
MQRLNALKKILQRHETEKKIRAAKILYPPPGISNGPPLIITVGLAVIHVRHFDNREPIAFRLDLS